MTCIPKGGCFVDVGANVGLYSLPLARHVGSEGRVLAIEPGSVALERLRFNISASDVGNVVVAPYAVGWERGEATLQVPLKNLGGARTSSEAVSEAAGEKVSVKTLLDILEEHQIHKIDGMKVDIEGSEECAILPLLRSQEARLLPRGIVLEHLHRAQWKVDCFEVLREGGYEIVARTKSNVMLRRK